jgi:hypothetical protein
MDQVVEKALMAFDQLCDRRLLEGSGFQGSGVQGREVQPRMDANGREFKESGYKAALSIGEKA